MVGTMQKKEKEEKRNEKEEACKVPVHENTKSICSREFPSMESFQITQRKIEKEYQAYVDCYIARNIFDT